MRSLEEWTKYLEQQEQALQKTLQEQTTSDEAEAPPAEATATMPAEAKPAPSASSPTPTPKVRPQPATPAPQADNSPPAESLPSEQIKTAVRLRKKLPKHLIGEEATKTTEVAQSSYKTFKESREELLQRLLDPSLTLEDTARVLNVCPTTVRRYTNKGILKHYRTAGNQRRFRLSDVLAFLESQGRLLGDEE